MVQSLEDHLNDACDVLVKKVDKKKDKQLLFAHRQSLLEQVETCQDPSQLLLLTCLVVFQFQVHGTWFDVHAGNDQFRERPVKQTTIIFSIKLAVIVVLLIGFEDYIDLAEKNGLTVLLQNRSLPVLYTLLSNWCFETWLT